MHLTLFITTGLQLAVTVLLIVPLISATPSPLPIPLKRPLSDYPGQKRDITPPPGWALQSCYTDDVERRTLTTMFTFPKDRMTVNMCVDSCIGYGNFAYAGLENGNQCFCGNITTAGSTKAPDHDCKTPCDGDISEICGGNSRLSLYSNGRPIQPNPAIVRDVGMWSFEGCYGDSGDARTLAVPTDLSYNYINVTVEQCIDYCDELGGYAYAGVEVGAECWCDSSIDPGSSLVDESLCSVLACSGNNLEYCGAAHNIIVYHRKRP